MLYEDFLSTKIGSCSVPVSYWSFSHSTIFLNDNNNDNNNNNSYKIKLRSDYLQLAVFELYHELGHCSLLKYSFTRPFFYWFYHRPWAYWRKLICSLEEIRAWWWAKKELQKTEFWKDLSFREDFEIHRKECIRTYLRRK